MKNASEFGKILRHIRVDNNETIRDMADNFSVSPAAISSIELGHKPVPIWMIPAIRDNYGLDDEAADRLSDAASKQTRSVKFQVDLFGDDIRRSFIYGLAWRLLDEDCKAAMKYLETKGGKCER